jgi:Flp pilus assembly pilin Flp
MFNALSARIMTWAMAARDEEGQGLVEYALILSLISVASIVALGATHTSIDAVFTTIQGALD